jgi:hypothetical protein
MKSFLTSIAIVLFSSTAAYTQSFSAGETFSLTGPVGSMFSINVQSDQPARFSGTFFQSFSFNQSIQNPLPRTVSVQNFNFNGNADFSIRSQINNNVQVFSSPGFDFSW